MEWTSSKDDPSEPLLHDFSTRPPPHINEFSALVTGFLATGTTPSVPGEWPIPHVTRNSRNDFQYEFSLSAGPDFDTGSADGGDERDAPDEDDVSTDLNQGTSTSEDTSVGVDIPVGSPKNRFGHPDDMRNSPAMSPVSPDNNIVRPVEDDKNNLAKIPPDRPVSPNPAPRADGSRSSEPSTSQKPVKIIQKKKARPSAKKQVIKAPSTPNAPVSLSQGTSVVQSGTLSHTKMCRDRLNNMFERLRHTLPPAPAGVEVKHKAQVLDYAIDVLKGMVGRTSQLEIELAVSSNKATMDWISKLVAKVDSLPEAAEEVMKLFSRRRGWMHAELWVAGKRPVPADADLEEATVLTFCTAVSNEAMGRAAANLDRFSKESESYAFRAREGVPGRVWSSMRPEWVTGLMESKNFKRSSLARKYGVKVCLAVPVTITGKIEAVLCFYDVKHRPYNIQCRELAMRLAWALGNAIGGKRAKVDMLTTSGTSDS